MTAIAWYVVRRGLRRRLLPTVGLVLLVALASGSVAGLVAGARRTAAAFPEFVEYAAATADGVVFGQIDPEVPFFAEDAAALKEMVEALPEVDRVTRGTLLLVEGTDRDGDRLRLLANAELDPGRRRMIFGRPLVVEGTWPDDDEPGAMAIDEELAARAGLEVGDTYRMAPYTTAQFGPAGEGVDIRPDGPVVDLRVEAIYRQPIDLTPPVLDQTGIYVDRSGLHLTPAYWAKHGPDLARYGVPVAVELVEGHTLDELGAALQERIPDRFGIETESVNGSSDVLDGIEDAVDVQARGMLAVAAVTGITGLGLVWLLLGRKAGADRARNRVLADLGLGPRGQRAIGVLEGLCIGAAGAVLGTATAISASRWVPFGMARRAELDPGPEVDVPALAVVAFCTVAAVVGGALVARRPATTSLRPRSSRVADALATRGLAPVPTTGVRFAFEGEQGGGAVPVRAALVGVAVAAGVVVAAATIGASMGLVRDDPTRRGAYGDAAVGNAASPEAAEAVAGRLDDNPDVVAYAGEGSNEATIDGQRVFIVTVFDGKGDLSPVVTEGRAPSGPGDIALGGRVMDRLGVAVGDTVEVRLTGEPVEMEVVGQALVEDVDGSNGGPGKAAIIHGSAVDALDPDAIASPNPVWFVVRFGEGVDHAAAVEGLQQDFPNAVTTSRLPGDLESLDRLGGLVVLTAVLVGVLGTGAALLAMIGAVSRRRRELAVLRTLGFARRQAAATVAWQATTFAVVGLVVGVPLGLVAGRRAWTAVAEGVGIVPDPVVPVATVVALATSAVLLLNLVAAIPAWLAARVRPADVLRVE